MNDDVAAIGDIHGNSTALRGILRLLEHFSGELVFTGDYVNRGPDSAGVIELLLHLSTTRPDTFFLAGNHDIALLESLQSGSVSQLIAMSGAPTIRSYVESPRGNVAEQLRSRVPPRHVEFLQTLLPSFSKDTVTIAHRPDDPAFDNSHATYFVHGHVPTSNKVPRIEQKFAAIDTGCGSSPDGRLSCFFWPSRTFVQVNAQGAPITDA